MCLNAAGYIVMSRNGKTHLEHRLIMEEIVGHPLRNDEVVHHVNGIRDDNRPENLRIMNRREHALCHTAKKLGPERPERWRLEHFLFNQNETQTEFAKRSGVPQSIVSRVCRGRDCYGKHWAQIEMATNGQVEPGHHFPVEDEKTT